jgi:flagellar hook assembly protein FlgD
VSGPAGRGAGTLGVVLFILLVVLAVAGFAVTRAVRSGNDLVNTVELSPTLRPDGTARVAFNLAKADDSVDVLIIDGNPGSDDAQVRALALGQDLAAGPHVFSWDGTGDDGEPVPPGLYALRVILGQEGRDIKPPGRIRVAEDG